MDHDTTRSSVDRHSTRTCKRLRYAAALALMWVLPNAASAQETATSERLLTKEQEAQLRRVLQSADAKIIAGFAGREKLREELQSQLRTIGNIKDPAARAQSVVRFQDTYKRAYGEVLQKSGVDLQTIANQVQPLFPHLVLQATDRLTIIGRPRNAPPSRQQVPPPATTATREVKPNEFVFEQSRSCSLAAGAEVTSTDTSVSVSTSSAVAGGCRGSGKKTAKVQLPAQRKSAIGRMTADLAAEAFAVGVVGGAVASSVASASIECRAQRDQSDVEALVVAMFAWVGSDSEQISGDDLQVAAPTDGTLCTFRASSDATTLAEAGGSSSEATVRRIRASVTVDP